MKRVAVLLLAMLGVAACGRNEPAQPAVEVPPWAKVAPEQIAEAKKHGVPVAFENDLGMRFVLIPAGTFLMGSPSIEVEREGDETRHEVTLTQPYYMQVTEVTNEQYSRSGSGHPGAAGFDGDHQPVNGLSWGDSRAYADWVSEHDENRNYDLPTEAQWEYACRSGTTTPFIFGETISTDLANYDGSFRYGAGRKGTYRMVTTQVGSFEPNAWGLHDVHGNVREWCLDWFGDYPSESALDPTGPSSGDKRVARGGSWDHYARFVRSAYRSWEDPDDRGARNGFRLVSPLPEPGER